MKKISRELLASLIVLALSPVHTAASSPTPDRPISFDEERGQFFEIRDEPMIVFKSTFGVGAESDRSMCQYEVVNEDNRGYFYNEYDVSRCKYERGELLEITVKRYYHADSVELPQGGYIEARLWALADFEFKALRAPGYAPSKHFKRLLSGDALYARMKRHARDPEIEPAGSATD